MGVQRGLRSLFLVSLIGAGWLAACGSDDLSPGAEDAGRDDDPNRPDSDTTEPNPNTNPDAAPDAGDAETPVEEDRPDRPLAPFPTTAPQLFGYTFEDAFPGKSLSGIMDIEWPRPGATETHPIALGRGGYLVQMRPTANEHPAYVLDFSARVRMAGEGGALGMALHPRFTAAVNPQNYVYVWYTNPAGAGQTRLRLSRFTWNTAARNFTLGSELVLIEQNEQETEHNGAQLRFGPDGYLYFGNGDDVHPNTTTQSITAGLFSGIFRIDVDCGPNSHAIRRQPTGATTQGYCIPNDNPFSSVNGNNREEYFALGFRNPYRFNFDRLTGQLWAGDIGDSWREEINLVESGKNYGWPLFEGTVRRQPGEVSIGQLQQPRYEYEHWRIADLTSVVGGYVYRGSALPELTGKLLFSDWPTGRLWALDTTTRERKSLIESAVQGQFQPVGFGQDRDGEVYVVAWSKILKLVRDPAPIEVPRKLSDTHIFRNFSTLKTSSDLVPFSIRSPLWSDGAEKQRWVHVPEGQTATVNADGTIDLPAGSILVKQFDLPADAEPPPGRTRRIETRVLVIGATPAQSYGVGYRWNANGTDADLVIETVEETLPDQSAPLDWHFPSFGECWSCHRIENRVIGFRGDQLNFALASGQNQLEWLAAQGVLDPASIASSPAPLASPSDESAPIEARALAYLAANCSSCHNASSSYLGGQPTWNALPNVPLNNRGLLGAEHHNYPMVAALDLPWNARLVTAGDAENSVLWARIHSNDPDLRMPPLGRKRVDPIGEQVIREWIDSQ